MAQGNDTKVTDFYLLGFGVQRDTQCILFIVFLVIYVTSMVGNTGMILLINTNSRLQTPMYFFLQHLAFVDICYTSAITPKMLQSFMVEDCSISYTGCVMQLLVYATFATSDCYLLAVMAVDRYVAICKPLRYPIIMSRQVCIQLPHSDNSEEDMKVASVFYGIVIPMLNPLIYSLRNKEVKEGLSHLGIMKASVNLWPGFYKKTTDFYLLGFGVHHNIQCILFIVFFVVYVTSMVGNTGMILLINTDSRLQTPMYFFLQHLAFVDICYTSAITPKMLQNFMVEDKSITFTGCLIQLFIYAIFATSDCYLLAVMAVDRYVAICKPLRYPIIMSRQICIQLVAGSYLMGSINSSVHTGFTFSLSFCKSKINHFFCDIPPIVTLSCYNNDTNFMLILIFVGFNLTFTVLVVIFSYIYIMAAILKMSSTAGRKKTFSTCASHLTAVTIFYGTLAYMYLQPHSDNSEENMKVASVFYGIVIPMLNPLIYSLRNKEIILSLQPIAKERGTPNRVLAQKVRGRTIYNRQLCEKELDKNLQQSPACSQDHEGFPSLVL
ncbi:olfactory receptor 5AK3 [Sigmodon hispidus]